MPKVRERDGVFQRKDRAGWFVSYIDSTGTRRKRKVVASTRTQALNALNSIKAREERDQLLGIKTQAEISLADLLKRYKRHQKALLQESTFERLNGIINTLVMNLPVQAKAITRSHVSAFIASRLETVKPATIAKEFNVLNHCLRLAVDEWGLLHTNAAHGVKLPKLSQGRTRYLSPTELRTALEAAPEWMRAPIALAAFTGMRRGELLNLTWRDVDLLGSKIYLHETKNGTLRVVALNSLAMGVLESLPPGRPAVAVLPDVNAEKLSTYTRRLFERVGIQGASFHSLRHTAASWLAMAGADLFAIGGILGHKTPRMTQRYAHLSPDYQKATVGRLDGVFGDVMPTTPAPLTLPAVGATCGMR